MPNYQNGKIYCIRSHQSDQIYIGSTTQPLSARFRNHRAEYRHYLKGKRNRTSSFDIIKHTDAYIELIELYPCNCKEELLRQEGKFIRKMDCVNKLVAGRTKREYAIDNKTKIKIQQSEKAKCDLCGCVVLRYGMKRHQKTLKCKEISKITV